ncbi:MAG: hypothetical protein DI533_05435 [Cereibacter sphaeroides]|uniref:Bacteriophage T5 Orf172 DNA-binding domain-containing protein n=1 Tax=Cereibacter sphaeroides TaxID=1063 RepID=A0A2W5SK77_CERSP|nr:MAG: hypothetical protein DI533_05435 [Cereibacter sphaeroides]
MREFILQEIRRLASANGGQAPGLILFTKETGIAEHQCLGRYWARWSDALAEAGFKPNDWNEKINPEEVLNGVISGIRHFGRLPTKHELTMYRQSNPEIPHEKTIRRHFGRREELIAALARRADEDPTYADIAPMLPVLNSAPAILRLSSKPVGGSVYLIKSGDFYKIGRSDDVEWRFKQIIFSLPDKAELFHTIRTDDPPGIEAYWHRRFADRRANGEWFKLTVQDVAAFKKRKFQ